MPGHDAKQPEAKQPEAKQSEAKQLEAKQLEAKRPGEEPLDSSSAVREVEAVRRWINGLPCHREGKEPGPLPEVIPIEDIRKVKASGANLTKAPDLLRQLTGISVLDLSNNELTSLPDTMFRGMNGLQELYLSRNGLTSIPGGMLRGINGLKILHLDDNRLTSLPREMLRDTNGLRRLDLRNNQLTSLPDDMFRGLAQLQTLYLSKNKLASLPSQMFREIEGLQKLNLSNNSLTSLPGEMLSLNGLHKLRLRNNSLVSLPIGIGSLSKLRVLYLTNNLLTSIPDELKRLNSLHTLDLRDNLIKSLPKRIRSGLTGLKEGSGNPRSNPGLYFGNSPPSYHNLSSEDIRVLTEGKTQWRRARVMIVGKGQVGKSSLYHAVIEKSVADIKSTIVADLDEVEISDTSVEGGDDVKENHVKIKSCEGINNLQDAVQGELLCRRRQRPPHTPDSKEIPETHIDAPVAPFRPPPKLEDDTKEESKGSNAMAVPVLKVLKDLVVDVNDNHPPLHASIWDFGGQEVFYSAHVLFIHPKSIYVVVFSLKDWFGENHQKEEAYLEFWLKSIYTYAKGARILIVATHLDILDPKTLEDDLNCCGIAIFGLARKVLGEKLGGKIRVCKSGSCKGDLPFFPVNVKGGHDPSRSQGVIRELRAALRQELVSQLSGEEKVHIAWARICDYCNEEVKKKEPWTTVDALQKRVKEDLGLNLSTEHVRRMLTKFNQLGACMYFNEPHLNKHVVLDPQVMIDCVKKLIYDRELHGQQERKSQMDGAKLGFWKRFSETGVLRKSLLADLWGSIGDVKVDEEKLNFLVKLLEKHMLLAEVDDTDIVVVPMLQAPYETAQSNTIRVEIRRREDASLVLEIISHALRELAKWPYKLLPPHRVWLHPLSEPKSTSPSTKIDFKDFQSETAVGWNHYLTHFCPIKKERVTTTLETFMDWDLAHSMLSRECDKRRRHFKKLLKIVDDFDNEEQIAKLIQELFSGREDEEDELLESISEFGVARESKLNLDHLKEILFIHRPQQVRESKDLSHDVRKWIESVVGKSNRMRKGSLHRPAISVESEFFQARLEIVFKRFMPFAYYQMLVAWVIRCLNTLSSRPEGQSSPFVGANPVSFDLSKQKFSQSMCEFRFSVAGGRDIVFRVTGPPPLSRQPAAQTMHPDFSLKRSIKSHFEGKVGTILKSKEHKVDTFYNDGRRCVQVKISATYVQWELIDLSLTNDVNASTWFLSLSYFLSFETIFDFMKKKCVKKAAFLSNMSPEIWRERYKLEAKECKQSPDDNEMKQNPDDSNKRVFVQLRPERDEFYSKNLKWEFGLFTDFSGGAKVERFKLPTLAS